MGKKATGFLEKTVLDIISVLRETIAGDTIATRRGFLQECDPRFKLISIVIILIAALFAKSSSILGVLYFVCIVLVALSSISLWFFFKRTMLFIPIFTLFIALPSIFSPITPGDPVLTFTLFTYHISITRQGIDSAVIFCLRVLVSVSFAMVMLLTTRHHSLLKVLRIFFVPQIFVMTLAMTYRYIFVLLDTIRNAFTGIKSRVGFIASTGTGRRIVALNMAGLWLRSFRMHHQVYDAMVSRGYTGEPVRRSVGYVFQNPDIQLFCPTVKEDILFGPLQLGVSADEAMRRFDRVVTLMRLSHLTDRSPHQLSIGEKKKVAIASVFAIEPEVLLLDEPTAGLDPQTTRDIIAVLQEAHAAGKTVIMATHDLHIVEEIADTIHVFGSDRAIIRSGTPEEILSDREFLQKNNLVHIHVHRHAHLSHTHEH